MPRGGALSLSSQKTKGANPETNWQPSGAKVRNGPLRTDHRAEKTQVRMIYFIKCALATNLNEKYENFGL